jgi:chromosome segregation ATPase
MADFVTKTEHESSLQALKRELESELRALRTEIENAKSHARFKAQMREATFFLGSIFAAGAVIIAILRLN